MTVTEVLAGIDTRDTPRPVLLDEGAKREIRRAVLTAVCVPGYQVPFGSREMPVARGWGSGGLQVTLGVISDDDVLKVIDQGDDAGVNAANLRRMIGASTGCADTADSREATVVQTRHRVPEEVLRDGQVVVYQVPIPEPLRGVQKSVTECARMHAEADYSAMWVSLYEDLVRNGMITRTTGYPVLVAGRYVMATTPIPRWDVPRLHRSPQLNLFGAGREKRIFAVPPDTDVVPLAFDDVAFEVEYTPGAVCRRCGSDDTFLVAAGAGFSCSDTDWCARVQAGDADLTAHRAHAPLHLAPAPGRRDVLDVLDADPPCAIANDPAPKAGHTNQNCRPTAAGWLWGCPPGWEGDPHAPAENAQPGGAPAAVEWALRVVGLGKVYRAGPGADLDRVVLGTGPDHGTAISPSTGAVVAAWDVSFDVAPGEALGLIGESGSGKSTVLRCIIGDEQASAGIVALAGVDGGADLLRMTGPDRRRLRIDTMAVVHQNPADGLDLRVSAGGNIAERLTAAGWRNFRAIRARAAELLERVEVPRSRMDDPVGTFSGGMRQRVQIAKALATSPPVLLLDEPTTGLDASVAAGVLDLLRGLLTESDIAAVVVSHDFTVIEALTERTCVLTLGRVVEQGLTDQLFVDPHHPYTQRLVAAARR